MTTFNIGDRVKKADADAAGSIPAYKKMRGTVVGGCEPMRFNDHTVAVHWDCDPKGMPPTWSRPESLALAEEP